MVTVYMDAKNNGCVYMCTCMYNIIMYLCMLYMYVNMYIKKCTCMCVIPKESVSVSIFTHTYVAVEASINRL